MRLRACDVLVPSVASFDIFDTVLVRALGRPDALFLLLGRRLRREGLIACAPEAFAAARKAADRYAYAKAGRDGGVTHEDICAELGALLGIDDHDLRAVARAELTLEAEVLRPSPVGFRLVRDARAAGRRVAYLSDMYLPSSFLRSQLARYGLWQLGDRLYVSSEQAASKRSGRLYRQVAAAEGVGRGRLSHHGNDWRSDVLAARFAGVRASHVLDGNLNRYERLLVDVSGLGAALAGASRLTRLGVPAATPHDAVIRDVTASVAAPLLVAYVLWALARARRLGLTSLYFLSRDGQVLDEIARRLDARLRTGVQLRYLYASRQAWNLASFAVPGNADPSWVLTHTRGAALPELLQRLGLAPAELGQVLERVDPRRPLADEDRAELLAALGRPPLSDLVSLRAWERRRLLERYLRQEGVLDDRPCALVDLVARGSQHRTAALLARAAGAVEPTGLYLGRQRHEARSPQDLGQVETYLFDEVRGIGAPEIQQQQPLLFAFCAADHGSLLAYEPSGPRVLPVLTEDRNGPALRWGLPMLRRTLACFVDALVLDPDDLEPGPDVRAATVAAVQRLWRDPSSQEAAAWGAFPVEFGSGDAAHWSVLGRPYRWAELLAGARRRRWAWPAGSLTNSGLDVRLGVRTARALSRH